jgi:hypothetical protein
MLKNTALSKMKNCGISVIDLFLKKSWVTSKGVKNQRILVITSCARNWNKKTSNDILVAILHTFVQVSLVIRGRYVPLFRTANTEFADKKTYFDRKFGILNQFLKCE